MSKCLWLTVAMAMAWLAMPLAASEASADVEERLRRLEKLVERQQADLAQKDQQIMHLQSSAKGQDALAQKISSLESGMYFAEGEKKPDDNTFKVYWKEGLKFTTANKDFNLALGGRIMWDWTFPMEDSRISDSLSEQENSTEFRRVRLFFGGDIYKNAFFKLQMDFAEDGDNTVEFKDVYMGLKNIPGLGTATIGNQYEPVGLEEQTSSKYITFMERSMLSDAFIPSRNPGISFSNNHFDSRLGWKVGVFREGNVTGEDTRDDTDDNVDDDAGDVDAAFFPSDGQANWAFSGRVWGQPWYQDDGKKMVHLGLSGRHYTPPDKRFRFRARPEVRVDRFVDTGTLTADSISLLGAEMAFVYKNWSLQAEYVGAWVDRDIGVFTDDPSGPDLLDDNADDAFLHGFYVFGSYFITGESRKYKQSSGLFDRVKPKKNFWVGDGIGLGAWEVALRYSWLNLDSNGFDPDDAAGITDPHQTRVRGGLIQNVTAGVNWYLNPNMRFMWNYVYTNLEDGDPNSVSVGSPPPGNAEASGVGLRVNGIMHAFMMRFQIDF
ncbi:MAG: porin [Planctomycetota bacterium]|nr:porin [Planctomycetota bacterium]